MMQSQEFVELRETLTRYLNEPTESNLIGFEKAVISPDPVSGWTVVATAGTVIGATAGVIDTINTNKKLKGILSQLSRIIGLQKQILDEIRALKVYFDQSLYNAFMTDASKDLTAHVTRGEIITASLDDETREIPDDTRNRLIELLNDAEQTALKLLSYGAASYQSTGISMILIRSLYTILELNHKSQVVAYKKFANRIHEWLREKDIGLNDIISVLERQKELDTTSFKDFIKERKFGDVRTTVGIVQRYVKIEGDENADLKMYVRFATHDAAFRIYGERLHRDWRLVTKNHEHLQAANRLKSVLIERIDQISKLSLIQIHLMDLENQALVWIRQIEGGDQQTSVLIR